MAAGEHPKVVQERLGHSTITPTLDNYTHVVPGMQELASSRLETLLATPPITAEAYSSKGISGGREPRCDQVDDAQQRRRSGPTLRA
jgi:hypothetical protein